MEVAMATGSTWFKQKLDKDRANRRRDRSGDYKPHSASYINAGARYKVAGGALQVDGIERRDGGMARVDPDQPTPALAPLVTTKRTTTYKVDNDMVVRPTTVVGNKRHREIADAFTGATATLTGKAAMRELIAHSSDGVPVRKLPAGKASGLGVRVGKGGRQEWSDRSCAGNFRGTQKSAIVWG